MNINRMRHVLDLIGEAKSQPREKLLDTMLLVYLIDWRSTLELGHPISGAKWLRADNFPLAKEVVLAITNVRRDKNPGYETLSEQEIALIKDSLIRWKPRSTPDLMKLAGSTFPMVAIHNGVLDLPSAAASYKRDFRREDKKEAV